MYGEGDRSTFIRGLGFLVSLRFYVLKSLRILEERLFLDLF